MKTEEVKPTKVKIPRAKNAGELFHYYANQVREGQNLGKYSFEGNLLCHGTTKLARIIDRDKKIVVIMDFNMGDSYGGGHSFYNVARAFSDEWTILKYDRLSNLYNDILTEADYFKIALYHIKYDLIKIVDQYGCEKELINNPKSFSDVYSYDRYKDNIKATIDVYVKKFKLSRKELLNHVYNERHYTTIRYTCWSSKDTVLNTIDKPIKFYLDSTKWHTDKEREVMAFKNWKYKHFNKGIDTRGKTYLEIYNDPDLKVAFEDKVAIAIKREEDSRIAAREAFEAKSLKENLEKLEDWLNGASNYNLWNIPIHMRIKDGCVETTRNARVSYEDGMKLFKLFNRVRNEVPPIRFTSKKEIAVGVYKFRNIELKGEHWYCTVGCHEIRDTEVDLFIERNNLQEWLK